LGGAHLLLLSLSLLDALGNFGVKKGKSGIYMAYQFPVQLPYKEYTYATHFPYMGYTSAGHFPYIILYVRTFSLDIVRKKK
jgi:hypothetical protein